MPSPITVPATEDLRAKFTEELDRDIAKLEPAVARHAELVEMRASLAASTRRAGRSRGSGSSNHSAGRQNRKEQLVAIVNAHPDGISVADAAKEMGIQPNYLYGKRDDAVKDGAIRRDGALMFPAAA